MIDIFGGVFFTLSFPEDYKKKLLTDSLTKDLSKKRNEAKPVQFNLKNLKNAGLL